MIAHVLTGVSLALAAPSLAQTTPPVAAPAIDPARHAAAAELVDLIFPPATREQMIAAWQRDLMTRSMSHVQADVANFSKQVEAIVKDKKP